MKLIYRGAWLIVISLSGAACSPTNAPPAPAASESKAEQAPSVGQHQPAASQPQGQEAAAQAPVESGVAQSADSGSANEQAPAAVPAWRELALTNAITGQPFTLADFEGKTVYVETFATWCPNCKNQLSNVKTARANLGDDVVVVALSVEPGISDEKLKDYAASAGFDWAFASVTPEMLRAMAGDLGQTVTNAPATPHFFIRPDGSLSDLATGIEAPDEIVQSFRTSEG